MVSPNTFAQLNPLQQIVALGGNAGAMVGGAVGNMMGGRTSKEAEGAMIKEVFDKASQMSEDPAEQYAFASKEFRRLGMNDRAMALEDKASGLMEKRDTKAASKAAVESRARALLVKNPSIDPEVVRSLAQDPEAWRKAMEGDKVIQETSEGVFVVDKNNPTNKVRIGSPVDRRNITTVDARSFNAAETEYGKVVGKDSATRDVNLIDAAESSAKNLPKMYETRDLIEKGSINTGLARSVQDVVSKAQSKFLADKKAGKNVSDSEYLDSLLGSEVFAQISALGVGARGMDTPAEREFMREVITGTRDLSKDTLKRMIDFRIQATEKAVDTYNERLGKGEFKKYQDTTGRTLKTVEKPTSTPKLRFNPATGRLEPI
jgi:hypothetical protein